MSQNEETLKILANLLEEKRRRERKEEKDTRYEKVKDILIFLGFFGACLLAPKAATELFKPLVKKPEYFSWKKFNKSSLKRAIHQLAKQKIVDIKSNGESEIVTLTENGRMKILKYAMEDLEITKPGHWDGKWRIVLYDISNRKRYLAQLIRNNLLRFGFTAMQESVYIFPYPCDKQIEYLRCYYGLNKEIKYIIASHIEDEEAYKDYFGLSK